MSGPRYQAKADTVSFQCCNDASVVDTTRLDYLNRPWQVCECPDLATAQKIALALNRTADT